jgi:SAM-dependent methyltransferase
VSRGPRAPARYWDSHFARWIAQGEAEGVDPNDIGDREWISPRQYIEERFLPWIGPDSVVLELGPGTGRIARHVIDRCREMILVDYSLFACDWLERYLAGKGRFRIHCIDCPALPMVADGTVDFTFAFGVFEHIGLDDMLWFLEEFHRVLVAGGRASFNFDNVATEEGIAWLRRFQGHPGDVNLFRFYHPETVRHLAKAAGFMVAELRSSESRHADIDLVKPRQATPRV